MERNIAYIALFAALTAALGFIPIISLGFGVPITAQTLGVMLGGCILGSWRGGLASLLLIVLIALGVPLLAGGRGVLDQTFIEILYLIMVFIPGDLIKAVISGMIIMLLCKYRPESMISRNG